MTYWVRGCPTGPRETSAGLQPARLDRSGNRVFTRRKATTSIGLKPMRLAVHCTTTHMVNVFQLYSILQHQLSSSQLQLQLHQLSSRRLQLHSSQQHQLSSRQLQLHSLQQTASATPAVQQTTSAPQHTATTAVQQTTPAPQPTATPAV